MAIKRKGHSIYEIAVPLMVIGTIAFSDIQILCLGSQAIAFAIALLALVKNGAILRDENRKYFVWSFLFSLFCMFSSFWASPNNSTAIRCSLSVIQGCLIGFTVLYLTDNSEKLNSLIDAFIIAGVIISARFFIQIPVSYWGREARFDNVPLFAANSTAVFLAYAAGIVFFTRFLKREQDKVNSKLINIVLAALFMFVSLMTGTKKGLLVFGIIVLVTYILSSKNPLKLLVRIGLAVVAVLAVYYLIMNVDLFYGAIGYRFERMVYQYLGIGGIVDGSTRERIAFVDNAIEVFRSHPIVGIGIDGFRYVNRVQFTYSHNNFAEILADLGIIGFIIYYSKYLSILSIAFKRLKDNQLLFGLSIALLAADYGSVTYSSELQFILLGFVLAMVQVKSGFDQSHIVVDKEEPIQLANMS